MAAQVVGKNDAPRVNGIDGSAFVRSDEPACPWQVLGPHRAVGLQYPALSWPWQLAAEGGERLAGGCCQLVDCLLQASQDVLQFLALLIELGQACLFTVQLLVQSGKHLAALGITGGE